MSEKPIEYDDERVWEQGWEGHELAQLKRLARLSVEEKIAWLDEAHQLVLQMQGTNTTHQLLYDEILRRFPEVAPRVHKGDEELPYIMVGHVVDWLKTLAKPEFEPLMVQRVVDFDRWCMDQPRGQKAENDIATIQVVAMHEKLFEHNELLPLIPHLLSREDVLKNEKYLIGWVGKERYDAALRQRFDVKRRNEINPLQE